MKTLKIIIILFLMTCFSFAQDYGYSTYSLTTADTSVTTAVNAPCKLVGWQIYNINDVDVWVQLFDGGTISLGTTAPKLPLLIPAGDLTLRGANHLIADALGIDFETSIKHSVTTTMTGSALADSTIEINLFYRIIR